jgi:hypothetical protein
MPAYGDKRRSERPTWRPVGKPSMGYAEALWKQQLAREGMHSCAHEQGWGPRV